MKRLQDYILEELEYDNEINEGKMWNAIKKWWNNLFSSSSNKMYDRYSSNFDSSLRSDYVRELNDSFNIKNIEITKINPSTLPKIVNPNGVKPNVQKNIGFTDFINEKISTEYDIYGISYSSTNISDTPALIKVKKYNSGLFENYLEILKVQIINEFENVLSLNKLLNAFIRYIKESQNISGLLYKGKNKSLYKNLIENCGFEEKTHNDTKVAYKKI